MPKDTPIPFEITRILIPSGNYYKGRDRWQPDMIVIHATEGGRASVIQTFKTPVPPKSTHFMVCKTGEIVQFVATVDTAFGNGIQVNPTDPTVVARNKMPDSNPNLYTISIEHELLVDEVPTDAQYAASAALIRFLGTKWGIPLDTRHVIPHHAIDAAKTCPNNVDIAHLLTLAAGQCA